MNNANVFQKVIKRCSNSFKSMPQIGLRIIKTAASVFILLAVFKIAGIDRSPFYAVIATILCMQSDLSGSKQTALNRAFGTTVGAIFALVFTILEVHYHLIVPGTWPQLILTALFVVCVIYVTVLFHKGSASYISCVVFLSATIVSRDETGGSLLFVLYRFTDTMSGILLAYCINWLHLPRKKQQNILFISELELLSQNGQMNPYTKRELNRLIDAGANFTISTSRTPAAIMDEAANLHLNLPVIAMDGAMLYDIKENRYLLKYIMSHQTVLKIEEVLKKEGYHYFENVIIDDVLLIYYQDFKTEEQKDYYKSLRKSPFRNYIHGVRPKQQDVVYFTLLDQRARLEELRDLLTREGLDRNCRFILKESKYKNQSIFHILCKNARKENMNHYLQHMLNLESVMTFGETQGAYDASVHSGDSVQVAKSIKKAYEPLGFD